MAVKECFTYLIICRASFFLSLCVFINVITTPSQSKCVSCALQEWPVHLRRCWPMPNHWWRDSETMTVLLRSWLNKPHCWIREWRPWSRYHCLFSVSLMNKIQSSHSYLYFLFSQYQEEIEVLNQVARHRPRSTLVMGIQQENRQIRELQHENKGVFGGYFNTLHLPGFKSDSSHLSLSWQSFARRWRSISLRWSWSWASTESRCFAFWWPAREMILL